jgi:hypothetical protein
MGTTCSSGLNNLLANSAVTQTSLPSWYTTAQQNIANQASQAQAASPAFSQTTGQNAVNTLTGSNTPFKQGESAVSQIASGAANPWITCSSTGQVTPNTNTALGGLFAAERQQLCQLMPQTLAPVQAGAIGSGNFGSLRGQTALDTARGNAFDTLAAQQMQAALQNQQTGVSAGSALGNLGAQCVAQNLSTATAQMNAPFSQVGNYSNLINALNVPGTTTSQTQLSPLNMLGSLGSAVSGGVAGACALLKNLGVTGGLSSLFKSGTGGSLTCLIRCNSTGYCKSSCGNLIVCTNDQSRCYSGGACTLSGCTVSAGACLACNYGGG